MNQELLPTPSTSALTEQIVASNNPLATLMDPSYLMALESFSKRIASSQLIPQHFRGKPDDVFIAMHMAGQMGADWLMVLQNLYVVHGTPGWSAKFIIAQANASGAFEGPIRFRPVQGSADVTFNVKQDGQWVSHTVKNHGITAYATPKGGGEELSFTVDMQMAAAEGWTTNPKYLSMPQLMLRYRAATFLVRTHAPEVLFGYSTQEELSDMAAAGGLEHGEEIVPTPDVDKLAESITATVAVDTGGDDKVVVTKGENHEAGTNLEMLRDEVVDNIRAASTFDEIDAQLKLAKQHLRGQAMGGVTKVARHRKAELLKGSGAEDGDADQSLAPENGGDASAPDGGPSDTGGTPPPSPEEDDPGVSGIEDDDIPFDSGGPADPLAPQPVEDDPLTAAEKRVKSELTMKAFKAESEAELQDIAADARITMANDALINEVLRACQVRQRELERRTA